MPSASQLASKRESAASRAPRDGWRGALIAAAVLHASSLAAAVHLAPPLRASVETQGVAGDLFDFETEPLPAPPGAAKAEAAPAPGDERAAAGAAQAKTARIAKGPIDAAEAPAEPVAPEDGSAPVEAGGESVPVEAGGESMPVGPSVPVAPGAPGDDEYGAPPSAGGILGVPGLGGPAAWSIPGVLQPMATASAAPTTAPAARPVDSDIAGKVLSGTLAARDREIGVGLPSAGAVVTTLESAVRGSDVPGDARATFEVRIGADGSVLGVRVVNASKGGGPQWDRVAKSAGAALASRTLTPTGPAAGKEVTVTVKVESKVVYPAGTKEKYDIQPVCAEEVVMEMAEALDIDTTGTPRGPLTEPAESGTDPAKAATRVPVDEGRKICIPIGILGQVDPSNIGTKPHRVVSSSYQVGVAGEQAFADPKKVDTSAPWVPLDPDKVRAPPKWQKKLNKKKRPRVLGPAGTEPTIR